MKKLLLATALAALGAAPAFAASDSTYKPSKLTGAYIGAYGGYDWTDLDSDAGLSSSPDGWDYGAFVGYKLGSILNSKDGIGMTGAIEGFYGWSSADDNVGGIGVDKQHEWGVSFRPGFSFLDKIGEPLGLNPYGIIGYRRTEFKANFAGTQASETFNGFELGVGTELVAYKDYGVRLDYSHTWYGEKSGIDPDSDDVRLGLAYHF